MNSYHDLRSVRAWLNQMYPDVPILVQRNANVMKKSYFFIQGSSEKFEDTGRGFTNVIRTVNIHLVTEGISPQNPGSQDPYWKTLQVMDFLRDRLMQDRVIPQFLFNDSWFPPVTWTKTGGTMTVQTIQLACTSIDAYDKESMLSSAQTVSLLAGDRLFVTLTNWPKGRPMAKSFVVYLKTGSTWTAIRTAPATFVQDGATTIELLDLTPLGPVRNPPSTSKQWLGYLKVDTATTNMTESVQLDDTYHGYLNLIFRSRRPERWKPAAPINTAPVTVSVD